MNALIITITVALLTGLTFLAYRHPSFYRPIGWISVTAIYAAFFAVVAWDVSRDYLFVSLIGELEAESRAVVQTRIAESKVLNGWWFAWLTVVTVYLIFIGDLRALIQKMERSDSDN